MMKSFKDKLKTFKLSRFKMMAVVLVFVLLGYNSSTSYISYCNAQGPLPYLPSPPVMGAFCPTTYCSPTTPCVLANAAQGHRNTLANNLESRLTTASQNIETWIKTIVDGMVLAVLRRFDQMELEMIEWWETMWNYGLLPNMQSQTAQLNTASTEQSKTFQSSIDAVEQGQVAQAYVKNEVEDARVHRPAEETCVAATQASGFGRAAAFSKAVRKGMQKASSDRGLGNTGVAGAEGSAELTQARALVYEENFCDPADNGGQNNCSVTTNPAYANADTQVTKRIYNALTINIDDAPIEQLMLDTLVDNMVGVVAAEPVTETVMQTGIGQGQWLDRRSYVARMNAIRSVPQLGIGWRMPGSMMGQWVEELRGDSNIPLGEVSDNPSYREIVHAVAIDRFNSGKYANKMITDRNAVEMEKLTLNAFYLMQLRDYYELLERQALMLSVQVAILSDQVSVLDVASSKSN